ncbi:chemotaxis protein CheW [Crocosphaera sp. UHCC 0190]|uniref:chemotaxis protein CheW n=1 Tax=Crocosphaera sp. UHCC 0190 TaxID=3110246 RepID=UPI002B1FA966|nr:chemotaxis protein CheW [Crocosphaera sp. UHCC 0190]MEA5508705.1 chemotaxis protein CheW [Crocosphaera sp. UHCC 0190]
MKQDYFGVELSQSVQLALPLENIGTVIQINPDNICLVPGVSPYLLGVINHQGSLLWILDTHRFLNLESDFCSFPKSLTAIILKSPITGTRKKVALVVKKLQGVLTLKTKSESLSSDHLLFKCQSFLKKIMIENNTPIGVLDSEIMFQLLQTPINQ